jgi:hypothetical protein
MGLKILRVDWIDLAQGSVRWRAYVKRVMGICVLQNGNFLKLICPKFLRKPVIHVSVTIVLKIGHP